MAPYGTLLQSFRNNFTYLYCGAWRLVSLFLHYTISFEEGLCIELCVFYFSATSCVLNSKTEVKLVDSGRYSFKCAAWASI